MLLSTEELHRLALKKSENSEDIQPSMTVVRLGFVTSMLKDMQEKFKEELAKKDVEIQELKSRMNIKKDKGLKMNTIIDLVDELNKKNKELVKEMDELGFTSLGHEAEYRFEGRTIYKGTYGNNLYLNPIKVAVFSKAKANDLRIELIDKEVTSVIEYFRKAKKERENKVA